MEVEEGVLMVAEEGLRMVGVEGFCLEVEEEGFLGMVVVGELRREEGLM